MREEIHRRIDTMAKCILLHGLGEKPSDWSDTVKYIDRNFEVSCPALFEGDRILLHEFISGPRKLLPAV